MWLRAFPIRGALYFLYPLAVNGTGKSKASSQFIRATAFLIARSTSNHRIIGDSGVLFNDDDAIYNAVVGCFFIGEV